jgi:ferredoxin, 2Fe-2S
LVKLTIVTRDGTEQDISAEPGMSLMEAIRNAGFDELQALCGGCLSCATCHVFIDGEHGARLSQRTGDELDLLEGSEFFQDRSRLSCQIPVDDTLDGARIEIAPED